MRFIVASCWPLFLIAPAVCIAQEPQPPKTHEVEQGLFKIDIELDGVIESRKMIEISIDTDSWTDLKIESVLDQGANVKKGDRLATFKTDKLTSSIEEKSFELELAKFNLETLQLELSIQERTLDLDEQLSERSLKQAEEDFDYFKNVERPFDEKSAHQSLKSSQWSLENAQDELEQLQMMYEEDELIEASEAIVLKRAQRGVEQAEHWLERSQQSNQRTLEVNLPRSAETKLEQLERRRIEHEKSQVSLPLMLEKQRITVQKTAFTLERQNESLNKLKEDLEKLTVVAPGDGVVYHGKCTRGKWNAAGGSGSRELSVGDAVTTGKTIMTIVDSNNIFIRCDLDEKYLGMLEEGMPGRATLVGFPDRKAVVSVESLNYIPIAAGKFDCKFKLDQDANLMPGLSCKIKVRTYENPQALTLPESAVFTDNDEDFFVFKANGSPDPKIERVAIKVGKSDSGRIEVVSGLSHGDKVLQARPTDK